jgi:hypothetical protein
LKRGYYWPQYIDRSGLTLVAGDSYYDGIVTPADRITLGAKLSPVRTFVEFSVDDPHAKARIWTVPVPSDAATFNVHVSPDHKRLLWEVQSNRRQPFAELLEKLPGTLRHKSGYLARWMISDLQGHGMRRIAEFAISDLHFNRPDLISPRWTPDSMHISFEYGGALYRISTDN